MLKPISTVFLFAIGLSTSGFGSDLNSMSGADDDGKEPKCSVHRINGGENGYETVKEGHVSSDNSHRLICRDNGDLDCDWEIAPPCGTSILNSDVMDEIYSSVQVEFNKGSFSGTIFFEEYGFYVYFEGNDLDNVDILFYEDLF